HPVVLPPAAVTGHRFATPRIDLDDLTAETKLDRVPLVESCGAKRQPLVRRVAREIVLRKVRAVDRQILVVAQHHEPALVAFAPEPLRGREPGRPAADDDDASRLVR